MLYFSDKGQCAVRRFFRDKEKDEYKEALKVADLSGQYDMLYERFFKSILSSFAALSDFRM